MVPGNNTLEMALCPKRYPEVAHVRLAFRDRTTLGGISSCWYAFFTVEV